jgi:hypothetical protein
MSRPSHIRFISLFDCPNSLLLSVDQKLDMRDQFISSVYSIVAPKSNLVFSIDEILRCALTFIGHDKAKSESPLTIMSSVKDK